MPADIDLELKSMLQTLDNDCGDFTLLLREHAASCKRLTEQSDERLAELVTEMRQRHLEGR